MQCIECWKQYPLGDGVSVNFTAPTMGGSVVKAGFVCGQECRGRVLARELETWPDGQPDIPSFMPGRRWMMKSTGEWMLVRQ